MSELPLLRVPIRPSTPYWAVVVDRDLPLRGQSRLDDRTIILRTWDEEVLLHETLHALLHEGRMTSTPGWGEDQSVRVNVIEEDLVSHLSHGLFQAGWRFVELEQAETSEDDEQ